VQTLEYIEEYWNSFAGWYNSNLQDSSSKYFNALLPFLDLTPDSVVLETACGTGNGLQLLLERTPATHIIGTDLAQTMLDIVRSKLGDRVSVQIADNENLPFEDASFTHYISNLSLHIVPDPAKMLSEAFRVLKPEGQLAVSVIGEGTTFIKLTGLANVLASRTPPDPEMRTYTHLADKSKALGLVREAGFEQILHFSETHHFPLKTPSEAADWICTVPAVAALQTSDPEHFSEVRAGVLQEIEALMVGDSKPIEFRSDIYVAKKPA